MVIRSLAAALLLLCACEPATQPTGSSLPVAMTRPAASPSTASPVTSAARGPSLGALLARPAGTPAEEGSYYVSVIGDDGRVVASVKAREPSAGAGSFLPKVSATPRGVYYLDGDAQVKLLRLDGTSTTVRLVPGSRSDRVIFAISPDDEWIAFSVISYGPTDPTCTVSCGPSWTWKSYVERLTVPSDRVELAAALRELNFAFAYPVGWRRGMVVLADGYPWIQNAGYVNPYAARERYALVDPKADRVTQRIGRPAGECTSTGPLVPAGTACLGSRSVSYWTWDGTLQTLVADGAVLYDVTQYMYPAALSPNGRFVAVALATSGRIVLPPSPARLPDDVIGSPIGWLDDTHLVFADRGGAMKLFDTARRSVSPLALTGESLAPYGTFLAGLAGLD